MLPPASEQQQKPKDGNGCPYLGILTDQATRHSYPSINNYCHFEGKPEEISLAQQQALCLAPIYSHCPVYQGEFNKKRQRPVFIDVSASAVWTQPWAWVVGAAAVIVLLIAAFAWQDESVSSQDSGMGRLTQPGYSWATSTPLKSETASAVPTTPITSMAVRVTPTATDEAAGFVTPSNTPSSTTIQIPSATPGPQLETPFGAAHTYLIHKVNAGESFPVLASRYGTSPEAIKKINRLETATILHPDQILILMPGVIHDWEAEPLLAVFLEDDIEVETLASQYRVTIAEIRKYNALGQEITILGGRWLVFPFRNITPTPTTVPLDTPDLDGNN